MRLRKALIVVGAALIGLAGLQVAVAVANPGGGGQEKITICHAAGLEGTTQYVTLTLAYPAVYGPAGHFFEDGTPRAGHEQDYLGACAGTETGPPPTTTDEEPPPTTTEPPPDPCEEDPTGNDCAPPPDPCELDPTGEGCNPDPPPVPCSEDPDQDKCGDDKGGTTGGDPDDPNGELPHTGLPLIPAILFGLGLMSLGGGFLRGRGGEG